MYLYLLKTNFIAMTINQILDKILSSQKKSKEIDELTKKLVDFKKHFGGNTKVENTTDILNKLNIQKS